MNKRYLDHEDRLEQQYQRLGKRNPICVSCAEKDPWCLELHHLARRQHHEDVSIICRNCHRKLTDQQRDHVSPMVEESSGKLAVIGHYLLGLCDLLAMLIDTLRGFGEWLLNESTYCGESIA